MIIFVSEQSFSKLLTKLPLPLGINALIFSKNDKIVFFTSSLPVMPITVFSSSFISAFVLPAISCFKLAPKDIEPELLSFSFPLPIRTNPHAASCFGLSVKSNTQLNSSGKSFP